MLQEGISFITQMISSTCLLVQPEGSRDGNGRHHEGGGRDGCGRAGLALGGVHAHVAVDPIPVVDGRGEAHGPGVAADAVGQLHREHADQLLVVGRVQRGAGVTLVKWIQSVLSK